MSVKTKGKRAVTDDDEESGMSYRAVCVHGKARMLVSDDFARRKEIAKELAECIVDGLHIERVTNEEARRSKFGCDACRG